MKNIKNILKLTIFSFLIITYSCNKDDEPGQVASSSATIANQLISFTNSTATEEGGKLKMTLSNTDKTIFLSIVSKQVGTYEVGAQKQNTADYNVNLNGGGTTTYGAHNSVNGGTIVITEYNSEKNYVSGNFSFEVCHDPNSSCFMIENGSFSFVPIN